MSPSATTALIKALQELQELQEQSRRVGQEHLEEPASPEYSILHGLDDNCILFAVKENQTDPRVHVYSSGESSLNSTQ